MKKQNELNTAEQMAIIVTANMLNILRDEDDRDPIEKIVLTDDNATDFFIAHLITLANFYSDITGNDGDLIDFTNVLTKLAVQHILQSNKGE